MSERKGIPSFEVPSKNEIHRESLMKHIDGGKGKKILVVNSSFPFLFIGKILDVVDDFVIVDVETTPVQELENRHWYIHIDDIEVFYIEWENSPKIPKLQDDYK